MASYVAPVLTVPQARHLLAAIEPRVYDLALKHESDATPGAEKRLAALEIRSLRRAAEELERILRANDQEGTP